MNHIEVKSQLARLLAKENIDVIQGEYRTAFFDVENRVLGLPNWDNVSKDVYDLLVGHEVGHALFTPAEGWHDSVTDVDGIPRSYLNIVEDIRIERKIQAEYPGLVGSFKRGYLTLKNDNFFGTDDKDLNTYNFIDRINLQSKLRDLVKIKFNDNELPLFNKAMAVDTWEDVVQVCKELVEFMNEQRNQAPEEQPQYQLPGNTENDEENINGSNQEGENQDSDVDTGGDVHRQSSSEASDAEEDIHASNESVSEPSSEDNELDPYAGESAERIGGEESLTDQAYREASDNLVKEPEPGETAKVNGITKKQAREIVVSYDDLVKSNKEYKDKLESFDSYTQRNVEHYQKKADADFKQFQRDNKNIVNQMVKEFEMRKAAYQYTRGTVAKTGSLDVSKLHEYKFSDDIFLKVTKLANAKSHGLVMFIDLSGSMNHILEPVIKQTLLTATFCKKVGIPFDVYGFTSHGSYAGYKKTNFNIESVLWGNIDHTTTGAVHLLSSTMKKATFNEAFKGLFDRGIFSNDYVGPYLKLGGTPLDSIIMTSHYIMDEFKAKHGIEKPIAVFLTDGESQRLNLGYDSRYKNHMVNDGRTSGLTLKFRGKDIRMGGWAENSSALLENLKSEGVMTIGIHLADRYRDANSFIYHRTSYDNVRELMKKFKRERSVGTTKLKGFTHAYVISASRKDLNPVDDEFVVADDATNRVLKSSFVKYTKSKKNNRKIMVAFAGAVAA